METKPDPLLDSLKDAIRETVNPFDELALDLRDLVKKHTNTMANLSLFVLGLKHAEKNAPRFKLDDSAEPEVLRSRLRGYLNVLAAIVHPLEHDSSSFEQTLHNSLNALEMTPEFWEPAFEGYKKNREALKKRYDES